MRERGDSLTRSHCATIHPHPSSRPGQWVHLPACLACSDNPGFEPVASRMPTALHSRALPPCRCGWVPETGIFDRASLHCDPPALASVSQNHRYAVPSPACSNLAREPDPSPPAWLQPPTVLAFHLHRCSRAQMSPQKLEIQLLGHTVTCQAFKCHLWPVAALQGGGPRAQRHQGLHV